MTSYFSELEYLFRRINYNNYTACINSDDIHQIELAVIDVLKQEGCRHISQPPLPNNSQALLRELLSVCAEISPYIRVVAISPGNLGWSVIKTFSPELFCSKSRQSNLPLISKLSVQQKCNAFCHIAVQRYWGMLVEANATGHTIASGFIDPDYLKFMNFYLEDIPEAWGKKTFCFDVPEEFEQASRITRLLNEKEQEKRKKELEILCNSEKEEIRNEAWNEWKSLNMSWFEKFDINLGKIICKSDFFWNENKILHEAYVNPKKLEQDNIRLLFFQSARFNLNPETEEIWSPITSKKNYGVEPDIPW